MMPRIIRNVLLAHALACSTAASANAITDWDAKAVAVAAPGAAGLRQLATVHITMLDEVKSIEPQYRPCVIHLTPPKTTSQADSAATSTATAIIHSRRDT